MAQYNYLKVRAKPPEPPKPLEGYINIYTSSGGTVIYGGFSKEPLEIRNPLTLYYTIKVREVYD